MCRFCLTGMLAYKHVYILTALTIFILLSNLSQILYVAFLFSVSIYSVLGTLLYKFDVGDN